VNAKQSVPFVSLGRFEPDPQLTAMVPPQTMQRYSIVPLKIEGSSVTVGCVDPSNSTGIDEVRRCLRGLNVRPVAVSKEEFTAFTERISAPTPEISTTPSALPTLNFLTETDDSERHSQVSGHEVLELVNQIIAVGIEAGASDIHVEPQREGTIVRFRVHGTLTTKLPVIPPETHRSLISRFKVLARLDITETRRPQEGRISLEVGGGAIDLRVSLIPTKLGQKLVMRILDARKALRPLDQLVLAERVRQAVRKMFYEPHGVVLVTGPTGSGKTTTLYSALLERRNPEINIVTVEDPVEFHLDGLSQVEVGIHPDIDFATLLRSFLRQDPDIILVGETRDAETAKLALQAGLTGRLVFTSFHTNDCVSAVVRLFEMGMEPFALSNSLVGVIHQRLVRRLCPHCREPFEYYPQIIDNMRAVGLVGEKVPTLYRSKGCKRCGGQGFMGRVSALEILVVTDQVRAAIARQASPEEILSSASSKGAHVSLNRYLSFLIQHGITVPGEALGALPHGEG
jgi:type IV pilus assembly protein PilB